ncbi:hypothetical protein E1161_25990 [Saccharopolyspora aridisoli]|uniref:Uncharacterized protein n=1 Tax=Saccharopolyspora aridisoli TaxID=2530385 RepID=A0A4R4UBR2_9PSEU|nr:hypothetical protein E1161_25990 [Saccharopolyspora aridisoli]
MVPRVPESWRGLGVEGRTFAWLVRSGCAVRASRVSEACRFAAGPSVIRPGVAALTRDRIAHVDAATRSPTPTPRCADRARIGLAPIRGGGRVASVDGMRFVVPVQTGNARHNPHSRRQEQGAEHGRRPGRRSRREGRVRLSRASLHVLGNDTGHRRDINPRPTQRGRHASARRIFQDQRGALIPRYYEGMEDQLGASDSYGTRCCSPPATSRPRSPSLRTARARSVTQTPPGCRLRTTSMLDRCSFSTPHLAAGLRPWPLNHRCCGRLSRKKRPGPGGGLG